MMGFVTIKSNDELFYIFVPEQLQNPMHGISNHAPKTTLKLLTVSLKKRCVHHGVWGQAVELISGNENKKKKKSRI